MNASPEIDRYDDPLGLDDPAPAPAPPAITATVTGLNEEEDAARIIALRFNDQLRFCGSCEADYEVEHGRQGDPYNCPRCGYWLNQPGQRHVTKWKMTK